MVKQTLKERILRHIVFNWTPNSVTQKQLNKNTAYRPQANFLAQAAKRGTMATIPQQPSKRIQREEAEAKKKAAAVPATSPAPTTVADNTTTLTDTTTAIAAPTVATV